MSERYTLADFLPLLKYVFEDALTDPNEDPGDFILVPSPEAELLVGSIKFSPYLNAGPDYWPATRQVPSGRPRPGGQGFPWRSSPRTSERYPAAPVVPPSPGPAPYLPGDLLR